jgi:CheY-like chemotaxis protein
VKILILDDQQYRHDVYARRFETFDAEVVHVYNPDEAAEVLGQMTFDLVFLDHRLGYYVYEPMPMEVTGLATAKLIAALPEDMRPKKVVVHSWDTTGSTQMAEVLRAAGIAVSEEPFSMA